MYLQLLFNFEILHYLLAVCFLSFLFKNYVPIIKKTKKYVCSPKTGRVIEVGGSTYKKVSKNAKFKNKLERSPKSSSKRKLFPCKSPRRGRKSPKGGQRRGRPRGPVKCGSPKGWGAIKPGGHERTVMLEKCGKKCFLGRDKTFPICAAGTCRRSPKGVSAACIRARQMSSPRARKVKGRSKAYYNRIAERALALRNADRGKASSRRYSNNDDEKEDWSNPFVVSRRTPWEQIQQLQERLRDQPIQQQQQQMDPLTNLQPAQPGDAWQVVPNPQHLEFDLPDDVIHPDVVLPPPLPLEWQEGIHINSPRTFPILESMNNPTWHPETQCADNYIVCRDREREDEAKHETIQDMLLSDASGFSSGRDVADLIESYQDTCRHKHEGCLEDMIERRRFNNDGPDPRTNDEREAALDEFYHKVDNPPP